MPGPRPRPKDLRWAIVELSMGRVVVEIQGILRSWQRAHAYWTCQPIGSFGSRQNPDLDVLEVRIEIHQEPSAILSCADSPGADDHFSLGGGGGGTGGLRTSGISIVLRKENQKAEDRLHIETGEPSGLIRATASDECQRHTTLPTAHRLRINDASVRI